MALSEILQVIIIDYPASDLLLWDTEGYKGFKGVKLGDNGWQGFTRAYRVLRKNIFLTRTSPDTFFFLVYFA